MKYEYLVIDFETKDPYIGLGLGAGWPYKKDFKVLGCAITTNLGDSEYVESHTMKDDGTRKINSCKAKVLNRIKHTDTLVVFNADYDIGILQAWDVDIEKYNIIDVRLMALMFDSSLQESNYFSKAYPYSLNALSKKYLGNKKLSDDLGKYYLELFPDTPKNQDINKLAITNMDILQSNFLEVVADYAITDTELTRDLYEFYIRNEEEGYYRLDDYSDLIKVCILNKAKGIDIDLIQLLQVDAELQLKIVEAQRTLNKLNGDVPVNPKSGDDVAQLLIKNNINLKINTATGNYICDKFALEAMNNSVAEAVLRCRELYTIKNNFIDKLIEMQKYTVGLEKGDFGKKGTRGRIHPTLNILGAPATGRFSCTSPNFQQLPGRVPEFTEMVRGLIIPYAEDSKIVSIDYSAQEPRIQIHLASMSKCNGVEAYVNKFRENPNLDIHTLASELLDLPRKVVKAINLGLAYGMGKYKLSKQLGLSPEETEEVLNKFFTKFGYLKEVTQKAMLAMKQNEYVRLPCGGHKLKLGKPMKTRYGWKTFEYKAFNKLCQGLAALQMRESMLQLYRAGLPFMISIHDEIVASIKDEQEVNKYIEVMENSIDLAVPSIATAAVGDNLGQCK